LFIASWALCTKQKAEIILCFDKLINLLYVCTLLFNLSKKFVMGRGDKKTKKGKIFKGSFGKSRPARVAKATKPAEEKKEA
jgi:30S ribosomal protein S31